MIFASTFWLDISINLLLIVFVIVCLLMSLLILMQRPKQEGLGAAFGGGVTDQVFGARTTNVLQKGTVYLGSAFFILALTLSILIGNQREQKSLLDPKKTVVEKSADKEEKPATEEIPKSLVEELPAEESPAPVEDTPAPVEEAPAPPEEAPAPPAEAPAPAPPAENAADKPE